MIDSVAIRPVGIPLAVIAIACAAALLGCGGDNGDGAQEVAQGYADAQTEKDFDQVCVLLSDRLREQFGGDNCPSFLEEQSSGLPRRPFTLISVDEDGDRAIATLETEGEGGRPVRLQISLERQDGDWRVTSVADGGD
jgi:hypothetical protein